MGAGRPRRRPHGRGLTAEPPAGYASVVLIHPSLSHLPRPFTYAIPAEGTVEPGALVRVPVRGRNRHGIVVEVTSETDVERVQAIAAVLGPGLPADVVDLARWTADRYLSTLGEALAAATPERVASEEARAPQPVPPFPTPDVDAFAGVRGGRTLLRALDGGSGAFVWRPRAAERRGASIAALVARSAARGRGALVLLPEVAVRSEVAASLAETFGEGVAWLGSDRSARERYRDWLALRAGAKRIAVGGRGAAFAPVPDLGLIVVDDEGHAAYKEGRAPRFHARAVAAERARAAGAVVVLVGVPPSIESRAAVESGHARMVAPSRNDELRARPPVTVIDRSKEEERLVPAGRTLALLRRAHRAGRRVVVLTHRGGAPARALAERTGRVLEARSAAYLDARSEPGALEEAVRNADVIVATPFVAKDLRVEGAGALAIVEADAALAQPEFRAEEDAFATWWHVSRWAAGGSVLIETADPRRAAITALARWDPEVLWRAEAARRTDLGYPPFAALARIDVPADRADAVARDIADADDRLEVLGPAERDGGTVIIARSRRREDLLDALRPLVEAWRAADEPMRVDVDPREVFVPKWRSSRSERSETRS